MKTIGMLGGTGWTSTISYYSRANELVSQRLGGYHSAKIILHSIDYHDIMSAYGKDEGLIFQRLQKEVERLLTLAPDCFMICCNSLHKFYDLIQERIAPSIPMIHALKETGAFIQQQVGTSKVLLLASKFTLEDGFFETALSKNGVQVITPNAEEREQIHVFHLQLLEGKITDHTKTFFHALIEKYKQAGATAAILGCTEFPMVLAQENVNIPLINPMEIQVDAAVKFALDFCSEYS